MDIAVKRCNGVNEIPYILIGGMENMRSVTMNIYPVATLRIHISTSMLASFYHKALFPVETGNVGENRIIQSGPHEKNVIRFHYDNTINRINTSA